MIGLFRQKKEYPVLKLYRVVNGDEYKNYNLFSFIEKSNFLENFLNERDNSFQINYERNSKKGYNRFVKNWNNKSNEIIDLSVFNERDEIIFSYGNGNVDLKFPKSKNVIDCFIMLQNKRNEEIKLIYNELNLYFNSHWAYVYYWQKGYSVIAENKLLWFGEMARSGKRSNLDCEKTDLGYIPQLYRINFLNSKQLEYYTQLTNIGLAVSVGQGMNMLELSDKEIKHVNAIAKQENFEFLIHK